MNRSDRRSGGAESYLGALVPALIRRGEDLLFWHEIDSPRETGQIPGVGSISSVCVAASGLDAALRALGDWQPDVLFVQHVAEPAREAALLDRAPAVFFAHDYYGTCISGRKTFTFPVLQPCHRRFGPTCLVNYFPRRCGGRSPLTMLRDYRRQSARLSLLNRYQTIVTFSEHMCREYARHGFAESVQRLPAVDPTPANIALAGREAAARGRDRGNGATRLAFIGRLDALKGCAFLLEALPTLREALTGAIELTVAGEGPDATRCRALATRITATLRDVRVDFRGWSSEEQVSEILADTHVLVVPSLWPEPFGLVGLEARRFGVPVAAFDVGGIAEWLDDGHSGALAPAPTTEGLAVAIERCLSDQIRTAAQARALADDDAYSIDRHIDALLPLLQRAAERPGLRS